MGLSSEVIRQFAKLTKTEETKRESTSYGTIVVRDGVKYVQLDGSNVLTPASTTVDMVNGERVTVMIKNHTAIVTGNISSPAARMDDVKGLVTNAVTDCIKLANGEVLVGNLKSGELLYNLLIGKNGVYIRSGTGNLLKIANDIVELGSAENTVNLNGKNIFYYVKDSMLKPYYETGDTVDLDWYGSGFISDSSANVYFSIPLSKPAIGTPSVTVESKSGMQVRQNSKYTHGSSTGTYALPSSYSAVLSSDGGMINIIASFSDITNAENDSPCGITASVKITFGGG